jgi:hypothetical protein
MKTLKNPGGIIAGYSDEDAAEHLAQQGWSEVTADEAKAYEAERLGGVPVSVAPVSPSEPSDALAEQAEASADEASEETEDTPKAKKAKKGSK